MSGGEAVSDCRRYQKLLHMVVIDVVDVVRFGAFGLWIRISIMMEIKELHVPLMDLLLQKPDPSRTGSFNPIPELL